MEQSFTGELSGVDSAWVLRQSVSNVVYKFSMLPITAKQTGI